jgi:hypothetical protein
MRYFVTKARGAAFILWHSRHEFYHILIGLVWAWVLRELWGTFSWRYIFASVIASLLPDLEHLFYFFSYGKKMSYREEVVSLFKSRSWRMLVMSLATGHKFNTNLSYHNLYFMSMLLAISIGSFLIEWQIGVIFFGAMVLHYIFDIYDDMVTLGYLNSNWKRWGRGKRIS